MIIGNLLSIIIRKQQQQPCFETIILCTPETPMQTNSKMALNQNSEPKLLYKKCSRRLLIRRPFCVVQHVAQTISWKRRLWIDCNPPENIECSLLLLFLPCYMRSASFPTCFMIASFTSCSKLLLVHCLESSADECVLVYSRRTTAMIPPYYKSHN